MLQVEGKTFHKFVEIKTFNTRVFKNYCPIEPIDNFDNFFDNFITKKNLKYFDDYQSFDEADYEKNYGNLMAELHFQRKRIYVEEGEDSISLKSQSYVRYRILSNRYFVVRKQTNFLTFNFKTKLFYLGTFNGKNKKKIGTSMKVNPTSNNMYNIIYALKIHETIDAQSYLYFFLGKIWEKLELKNPQNFKTNSAFSFYSLTKYLIQGVKLPNEWIKLSGTFVSIKDLRKNNMNLVDTFMSLLKIKGSKAKKILNEVKCLEFERMVYLYRILGIDRFNKLDVKIFEETLKRQLKPEDIDSPSDCYHLTQPHQDNYLFKGLELTDKEKDRIVLLCENMDNYLFSTLCEHINFKRKLKKLGENVKMKFNSIHEFNAEHEEWSRLIQSYRTGEIERFYGDIDSLESPIPHQGEIYYPVLLKTSWDYEKESQHQKNCVRTYVERADSIIFSIRKDSKDGEDRITVEYQFRSDEVLNVQERAKYNYQPSLEFSEVANIQLANINLLYKLKTLKLPTMVKKYRNGKVIEQVSAFQIAENSKTKIVNLLPKWENETEELNTWQHQILEQDYLPVGDNNFFEDLLP